MGKIIYNASTSSCRFSICTIINNHAEYAQMKESFYTCGFGDDCEYLLVDNTNENKMDAYAAIPYFLQEAKGSYIIIVHQDVRCIDGKQALINILDSLQHKDPQWAVCGNAGCIRYDRCYYHLINNNRERRSSLLPKKVRSLDENFLVIKAGASISLSPGLSGFHLYGTDICLNASLNGHTCYVIPFMVHHLSLGNLASLALQKIDYIQTVGNRFGKRFVQTTCTKFVLGGRPENNLRYNRYPLFNLIKSWQRIKTIFSRN